MVVVVPAFAEGQERDPEAVARIVCGVKAPRAPQMSRRIHQPGEVQPQCHAQKDGPQGHLPTQYSQDQEARNRQGYPVPAADPDMEAVIHQVPSIGCTLFGSPVHRFAAGDPTHVRPPFAVARRMRIARLVRVSMVEAMNRNPEDGTALERHCAENSEQVFQPLRGLVRSMGQQAVVSHPNAEAASDPPQEQRQDETFPAEEEEGCNSANMKHQEDKPREPVGFFETGGEISAQAGLPGRRDKRSFSFMSVFDREPSRCNGSSSVNFTVARGQTLSG